jgi:hypothetical protein
MKIVEKMLEETLGTRASALVWQFSCMDLAWGAADKTGLPITVFQPSDPLSSVRSDSLYTAHVDELVARHQQGRDLQPGTLAEVACILHSTSLATPLGQLHAAVYWRVFDTCIPDHGLDDPGFQEPYENAIEEEIHRMRKKLTRTERKTARKRHVRKK